MRTVSTFVVSSPVLTLPEREQRPNQQRRANQKDQRQGHLRDDEHRARSVFSRTRRGTSAARFQRVAKRHTRPLKHGSHAEQDRGPYGYQCCKAEDAPIHADR